MIHTARIWKEWLAETFFFFNGSTYQNSTYQSESLPEAVDFVRSLYTVLPRGQNAAIRVADDEHMGVARLLHTSPLEAIVERDYTLFCHNY